MTMQPRPVDATWMCRTLPALIGTRADGIVRSVSDRAINVMLRGRLVWLVASGSGRLPGGIGLEVPRGLRSLGLAVGDSVVWTPGGLHVTASSDGAGPPARTLVSFAAAVLWDARLGTFGRVPSAARLRRAWRMMPAGGFGDPMTDPIQGWGSIDRLRRGLRSGSCDVAWRGASELIGRGPGLTPSGDDLLVGCSAAMLAFGHAEARTFAMGMATAAVERTSAVAQAYHDHAASGRFAEHLHGLVQALSDGGGDLGAAVARSTAWGATSGADAMLGVLLGAQACADQATLPAATEAGRDVG